MNRECVQCGKIFLASRSDRLFCAAKCRAAFSRQKHRDAKTPGSAERQRLLDRKSEIVKQAVQWRREEDQLRKQRGELVAEQERLTSRCEQWQKALEKSEHQVQQLTAQLDLTKPKKGMVENDEPLLQFIDAAAQIAHVWLSQGLEPELSKARDQFNKCKATLEKIDSRLEEIEGELRRVDARILLLQDQHAAATKEYNGIAKLLDAAADRAEPLGGSG